MNILILCPSIQFYPIIKDAVQKSHTAKNKYILRAVGSSIGDAAVVSYLELEAHAFDLVVIAQPVASTDHWELGEVITPAAAFYYLSPCVSLENTTEDAIAGVDNVYNLSQVFPDKMPAICTTLTVPVFHTRDVTMSPPKAPTVWDTTTASVCEQVYNLCPTTPVISFCGIVKIYPYDNGTPKIIDANVAALNVAESMMCYLNSL